MQGGCQDLAQQLLVPIWWISDLCLKSRAFGVKQHGHTTTGTAVRDECCAVAALQDLCSSEAPACAPAEAQS